MSVINRIEYISGDSYMGMLLKPRIGNRSDVVRVLLDTGAQSLILRHNILKQAGYPLVTKDCGESHIEGLCKPKYRDIQGFTGSAPGMDIVFPEIFFAGYVIKDPIITVYLGEDNNFDNAIGTSILERFLFLPDFVGKHAIFEERVEQGNLWNILRNYKSHNITYLNIFK